MVLCTRTYGWHPGPAASAMDTMIVVAGSSIALIVMNGRRSWSHIGDWEDDTVMGKGGKSALLTRVERKTLYTVIMRLTGKQSALLAKATVEDMEALKAKIVTITLDADIYFAHPYASWERGANENIHGLIRQYFPKRTDFNEVSDEQIQQVMDRLNHRLGKTRGG